MGVMRLGYAHVRVTDMAEAKDHYANTLGLYETLSEGNKTERGREVMALFRITAFESVPDDYEQNLIDIIKVYPAPFDVQPVSTQR